MTGFYGPCYRSSIYAWGVTNLEARLVGNLVGPSKPIASIAFSSSLSPDPYTDPPSPGRGVTDNMSVHHGLAQIKSVHLFVEEGMSVASDSCGAVKTCALTVGTCNSSLSTPS